MQRARRQRRVAVHSSTVGDEPESLASSLSRVRARLVAFLTALTSVPRMALKVSGHEAGRLFVLCFGGAAHKAMQYADEAFLDLREWRRHSSLCGARRSQAQAAREGGGKRLALAVQALLEGMDFSLRTSDGVVLRGKRRFATVVAGASGAPDIIWNQAELAAPGLAQAMLIGDLACSLLQGAVEPEWSR